MLFCCPSLGGAIYSFYFKVILLMHVNPVLTALFVYLLFSLAVGFYSRRKTKTFKQFAVGDKNFSVATLVTTFVATNMDGGYLGYTLAIGYTNGLRTSITFTAIILAHLLMSRYVAPRMGEFMQHLSIAESMGVMFGKTARAMTAIVRILHSIVATAIQLYVIIKVIKFHAKLDTIAGDFAGYIVIGIVVIYCTLGGIKAVTFTDVIQLITFATLMPILIYLVSTQVTHYKSFLTLSATQQIPFYRSCVGFGPEMVSSWLYSFFMSIVISITMPYNMQRIYMAKNIRAVKSLFFYKAIVQIILNSIILLLAMLLLAYDTNLTPIDLMGHILEKHPHVWLIRFVCIAIVALAMSTADSLLHAASVLLTHDIVTVFKWEPKNKLKLVRLCSLGVGVVAMLLVPLQENILKIHRGVYSFFLSTIVAPFILAIFGFRPSTKALLLGMGAGVLTNIALISILKGYFYLLHEHLLVMFMNLLFAMVSHYLLPKVPGRGWVKKPRSKEALKQYFQNFKLFPYLKALMPTNGLTFFSLGCYALISQYIQMGSHMFNQFLPICFICLASLVFIYPTLKEHLLKRYHTLAIYLYPMLIFILLFLSSSYILSLQGYTKLSVQLFLTHIAVTLFLLPWYLVLFMVVITLSIMYGISPISSSLIHVLIVDKQPGKFLYTFLFFIVVYSIILHVSNKLKKYDQKLGYFDREKEINQLKKLKQSQYHYHANRLAYTDACEEVVIPKFIEALTQLAQDQSLSVAGRNDITKLIDQLAGHKKFIEESFYNREYHLVLEHKKVDIQQIINRVIHIVSKIHQLIEIIVHPYSSVSTICADPIHLEQLFTNSIYYVVDRGGLDPLDILYVHIMDTSIEYNLSDIEDFTKTLPALAFIFTTKAQQPVIKPLYKESLDRKVYIVPTNKTELYKRSIVRIVNAHYGCSLLDERAFVACILPIALDEIRDEVMNSLPPAPDFTFAETEVSVAQETALVNLLSRETSLSQEVIVDTIQFIKRCHGDQRRASGEPYYMHPMAVTKLLLKETNDPAAVLSALLHDVVEDSKIFNSYIQSRYGSQVAEIVAMVTHMSPSFRKKKLSKEENENRFRRCKDIRAIQVKMADRLHNVLTLRHRPIEKQVKVVRQTLDFYLPFSESMGVVTLTKELRMLCEEILRKYEESKLV